MAQGKRTDPATRALIHELRDLGYETAHIVEEVRRRHGGAGPTLRTIQNVLAEPTEPIEATATRVLRRVFSMATPTEQDLRLAEIAARVFR